MITGGRFSRVRGTVTTALACVALAWVTGCGGGGATKAFAPKNPFPERATVAQLAAAPATPLPAHKVAALPAWRVDSASVPDEQTAVETKYDALTKRSAALAWGRGMRCVARELGRAYLEQNAEPDPRLQRFILGACAVTTEQVTFAAATGTAPATMSDVDLLSKWHDKLSVPAQAQGKPAGMWISRKDDQVAIIVALAREANVLTVTAEPEARMRVRGTLRETADLVVALVNRGAYGVGYCDRDATVALPEYAFTCAMAPEDTSAWVEVAAQKPEHVLLHAVGRALLRRDATIPAEFAGARSGDAGQGDSSKAIVDGINRARAAANVGALLVAAPQSDVNQRVAGHYFGAALASDDTKSETMALGLMAGWEIQGGVIRNGDFYSALVYGAAGGASWLDYALESPLGRFAMLSADARQIAVGTQGIEGGGGLAAVVTTYAFFEGSDHEADATRLFERLNRTRAAKGLRLATRGPRLPNLVNQAKLVSAGQREAMDGLEYALGNESERTGLAVRGWIAAGTNVETLPLPPELLRPSAPNVSVEVTHYKPAGAAWGYFLVYFLVEGTAQTTARGTPVTRTATLRR